MAEQPQDEVAKSGCFSRFFRLLLCAHSTNAPPIHPSDHFPPPQTRPSLPNKPNPVPTTPTLVARLMGLDSLPNTSRVSNRILPDSIPRSKSVNFIDYLLQLDPTDQQRQEANHRRVRTSSFREVPVLSSSFQPEKNNGDVVVFLWDDVDAAARESRPGDVVGQSLKKQEEVGSLKKLKKQRKEKKKKISKLKNEPRTRVSVSTSTRNYGGGSLMSPRVRKEEFVEPRFKKKVRSNRSSLKKMKNESCYENLSPVSVLDVGEDQGFPLKNKTNFTDETKGMASKSKRESSADERGSKSNIHHKSETEECSELMAANLRKLTENDVQQMFDSVGRKGVFGSDHCFEEIPLVLEHKIFDLLLREVVHELLTL